MKRNNKLVAVVFFFILCNSGCGLVKQKCDSCDGKGKTQCTYCFGTAEKNCGWCFGDGKQNCSNCNGTAKKSVFIPQQLTNGYQYVSYLGQTEYVWVWGNHYADFPCQTCQKTGKVKCSNLSCNSGKTTCDICNGKGEKDCTTCNGTGKN